jgi:uncharacterized membrane protein
MTALLSPLLILHVLAAIFWVGTTLFMVLFLEPTVAALGADGGKFMQKLIGGTRLSPALAVTALLTVLTGLAMYGPVTGNSMAVMFGDRLPLTSGAVAGILSAITGGAMNGRASARMQALGKEIAAKKGPPAPAQLAEMQKLQATLRQGSRITAILMVIAVVGMTW